MIPDCQRFEVRTHQPTCTKPQVSSFERQVDFIFSFGPDGSSFFFFFLLSL